MVFKMFAGGTFEHTHERKQMDDIRKVVQRIYKHGDEWCSLFADIRINGRQLDGFILKKDNLIILEMKNYHGKIVADLREGRKWIIDPLDDMPFEPEQNPFFQVRKQRGIMASKLAMLQTRRREEKENLFRFICAWVIVPEDTDITIISNDKISEKWFKVLPIDKLEKELPFQVSREELHFTRKGVMYKLAELVNAREKDPDDWLRALPKESLFKEKTKVEPLRFRALDHMLASGSPEKIIEAKKIIITLELHQYTDDLLKLGVHPDPAVRYHVLDALQYLPYEKDLTPILLEFMKDEGEHAPGTATARFSFQGQQSHEAATSVAPQAIRELATSSLIAMGSSSVTPELVKIIKNKESHEPEVMNAVKVLKEIGDATAVKPIIELTRNYLQRFPDSKRFKPMEDLISALGETASPKAVPRIRDFLQDPDEETRHFAIEALGRIGDEEAKKTLLEQLNAEDVTKAAVISALGEIAEEDIARHLYPYLETDDWYTLARTLEALRNINQQSSFTPIWNAFVKTSPERYSEQNMMVEVLAQIDEKKLEEHLLPLLRSDNIELRKAAARSLHGVVSTSSLNELQPFLDDPDTDFRHHINDTIVTAIRKGGDEKEYLPGILELLKSGNEFTRELAVGMAIALGGVSVLENIMALKGDPSPIVRQAVALQSRSVKNENWVLPLIEMLDDDEEDVRTTALSSLKKLADSNVGALFAKNGNIPLPHPLKAFLGSTEQLKKDESQAVVEHFWGGK